VFVVANKKQFVEWRSDNDDGWKIDDGGQEKKTFWFAESHSE
jgi:hypothetical protein